MAGMGGASKPLPGLGAWCLGLGSTIQVDPKGLQGPDTGSVSQSVNNNKGTISLNLRRPLAASLAPWNTAADILTLFYSRAAVCIGLGCQKLGKYGI